MSIDQKAQERFCGYCNEHYFCMTMEEFLMHLDICEREAMKWYRRCKEPPKEEEK